jgi:hypothetical protein
MTKRRPKKMAKKKKKKSGEKKLEILKKCRPVLPNPRGRYYRRDARRYWIRCHPKRYYRN